MENPGQSIPLGKMPNADQEVDIGMMPHDLDQNVDVKDPMLDSNEIQTLEHGGYGGEQEYMDTSPIANQAASNTSAAHGEYINQTDMTDQTGDSSMSELLQQSGGQLGDKDSTNDTRPGDL